MIDAKFSVDYRVFDQRMGALFAKVFPYMKVTWMELAQFAWRTVKTYTPPTRSGRTNIKELWGLTHTVHGAIDEFVIANTYPKKEVLVFFEEGTKAHTIYPRFKTVLRFFLEGGEEVFSKHVHHPGTPAFRMVGQAERETNIKIQQYITGTFEMVDRMMGGGGA